jgi:hypothetical protein
MSEMIARRTGDEVKKEKTSLIFLREMLSTNKDWALRAIERVYERQTDAEKASDQTKEFNKVGFSGTDAEFLSSLAKQYSERKTLSPKQINVLFRIIPKYTKQIWQYSGTNKEALYQMAIKYNEKKKLATAFIRAANYIYPPLTQIIQKYICK